MIAALVNPNTVREIQTGAKSSELEINKMKTTSVKILTDTESNAMKL